MRGCPLETSCRCALFVVPSLRIGGAERVMVTLANQLAGQVDLHLAVLDARGPLRSQLSPSVTVHDLAARRALHSFAALRRLIWRLRPDAVLTTAFRMNLVATLLAPLLPPGTRLVIREVTVLEALLGRGLRGAAVRTLAARAFARAETVVCQTDAMRADLRSTLRLDPDRLVTIFNPVDYAAIRRRADEGDSPFAHEGPGPHVVGVGRLEPAKGFDRLIHAFPALVRRRPEARLWLIGDGAAHRALQQASQRQGIAPQVHFAGAQENPFRWMKHADLFVLPSRREGLPNALLEALACGCPVVALDHPGGTREFLTRVGQPQRVVTRLDDWDPTWFHRLPASAAGRARELTDVRTVAEHYRRVLSGERASGHAA